MAAHVEHLRASAPALMAPLFPGSFCGYTHRPEELRTEIAEAGLVLARAGQRVPELLGLGPHLLAIARVP